MIARRHPQDRASELHEVLALSRLERVFDEKGYDVLEQMLVLPHAIGHPVAVVLANHATPEEGLESVQNLDVALVLHDGEFRQDLVAGFHPAVMTHTDVKAAFTVHETNNPLSVEVHRSIPNIKSLRVPAQYGSSLRIVPIAPSAGRLSAGFLLPADYCERVPDGCRGVSRTWFGFTKASFLTLGPS